MCSINALGYIPMLSMVLPIVGSLLHLLWSVLGGVGVLQDVLLRQLQDKFGNLFEDDKL